jgi:radical SAM superfamily enzyme YgiQ (UPF0313 family)
MIDDLTKMGAKVHAHTFMPLPQTKFSQAKPGKISESLRKKIKRLTSQGLVYGDWKKQEELAQN